MIIMLLTVFLIQFAVSQPDPQTEEGSSEHLVESCFQERCFFSTVRKTYEETMPRPRTSVVSSGCSNELDKFSKYSNEKVDPDVGTTKALALLVCRGTGQCDLNFEDPKVVEHWENLYICEHHANELLVQWKSSRVFRDAHIYREKGGEKREACSMPDTIGMVHRARPANDLTKLTLADADALIKQHGTLVHPGIMVCRHHRKLIDESKRSSQVTPKKRVEVPSGFYANADTPTCSKDAPYYARSTPKKRRTHSGLALKEFAEYVNVEKVCFPNKPFSELGERFQSKKACAVKKMFDEILIIVAEDDADELRRKVLSRMSEDESWSTGSSENFEKVMQQVSTQFLAADDRKSKTIVLSIVADALPFSIVEKYVPHLSQHMYRAAKITARRHGTRDAKEPRMIKESYKIESVQFFIDFITSSTVMIGLPYGMKKVKLSDGSKVDIPNTIRQQSHSEIFDMYMNLLKSTDQMSLKLSKSSVFRILDVCVATDRKATTCVDYFTANGMESFDNLHGILDRWIEEELTHRDTLKQLKTELFEAAQYFRTDYRLHVKKCSRVPDHCATLALSDPTKTEMASSCSSVSYVHKYDLRCDRCERANVALNEIYAFSKEFRDDAKNRLTQPFIAEKHQKLEEEHDLIYKYLGDINEMKKHYLRAAYTSQEREDILSGLQDGDALITLDFAQKYLPRWHREKQSDYFGKKGISYHISHVAAKIGSIYTQHSFVHIYDREVSQDSKLVVLTLLHVLSELKKVGIRRVHLRSDNAGSYHCATTINSMHWLMEASRLEILSYSFSEAQNGKSSSDRDASRVKKKAESHVAKGNDITTSEQFFEALKKGKLLNGMSIHHGSVTVTDPGKSSWSGIANLNHFTFEKTGIRGRRYGGIGEGQLTLKENLHTMKGTHEFHHSAGFLASDIESIEKERNNVISGQQSRFWYFSECKTVAKKMKSDQQSCDVEEDDVTPEIEEGNISEQDGDKEKLYSCPEEECSAVFLTHWNLEKHLVRGKHKTSPQKLTLRDAALKLFIRNLEEVDKTRTSPIVADALNNLKETTGDVRLQQGWALPQKQTRKPFETHVKKYLIDRFDEGLKSKRLDPRTVEKRMRTEKKEDGTLMFSVSERKDFRQIAGFFSREAEKRRSNHQHRHLRAYRHLVNEHEHRYQRDAAKEEVYVIPEEEHDDAGWIKFLKDVVFWSNYDELMQSVHEKSHLLFEEVAKTIGVM